MKLAICNETFKDWPFEKAFAFARELGYTGSRIRAVYDQQGRLRRSRGQTREESPPAGRGRGTGSGRLALAAGVYRGLLSDFAGSRRASGERRNICANCQDFAAISAASVMVLGSPMQRNLLPGVSLEEAMGLRGRSHPRRGGNDARRAA